MNYKISKELFEKVMFPIRMNPIFEVNNTQIGYLVYGPENSPAEVHQNHKRIPVNDFFFKCKEWALEQGYTLTSDDLLCYINLIYVAQSCGSCTEFSIKETIIADSEQQAVFDACQWILDNKYNYKS